MINEWSVVGDDVVLTLTEGEPVEGAVETWTPAGITLEGDNFYSWIVITNWEIIP